MTGPTRTEEITPATQNCGRNQDRFVLHIRWRDAIPFCNSSMCIGSNVINLATFSTLSSLNEVGFETDFRERAPLFSACHGKDSGRKSSASMPNRFLRVIDVNSNEIVIAPKGCKLYYSCHRSGLRSIYARPTFSSFIRSHGNRVFLRVRAINNLRTSASTWVNNHAMTKFADLKGLRLSASQTSTIPLLQELLRFIPLFRELYKEILHHIGRLLKVVTNHEVVGRELSLLVVA